MKTNTTPSIPGRALIDASLLAAIEGVLSNFADKPEHPAAPVCNSLLPQVRDALSGPTVADTHALALAQLCATTLDAMAARSTINDNGDYVIRATDAETADEVNGIQVIAELNTLRAYLGEIVAKRANTHPLSALVAAYRGAIDLLGSLRASMDALGFYDGPDSDTHINGGDVVDALAELQDRITATLNDGLKLSGAALPPESDTSALSALASVVDQLHGIGIPHWHGAEGLDLRLAERLLRTRGFEVTDTAVTLPATNAPAVGAFEVERTWVLSSDHIPCDLFKQLQRDAASLSGTHYVETHYADFAASSADPFMVMLDIRGTEDGDGADAPHASLSSLIEIARSHGFTHLRLDRDGPLVDGLPRVGHGVPESCMSARGSAPGMGG